MHIQYNTSKLYRRVKVKHYLVVTTESWLCLHLTLICVSLPPFLSLYSLSSVHSHSRLLLFYFIFFYSELNTKQNTWLPCLECSNGPPFSPCIYALSRWWHLGTAGT